MKKILCYIAPTSVAAANEAVDLHGGSVAEVLRRRLDAATEAGLSPAPLPSNAERRAIDFDESVRARVDELAKRVSLAPGRVIGGLLLALDKAEALRESANPGANAPEPELQGLRPDQARAVADTSRLLRDAGWVLLEAGTGSGKSRMAAHLARYVLRLRDARLAPQPHPQAHSSGTAFVSAESTPSAAKHARVMAKVAAQRQLAASSSPSPAGPCCVIVSAPTVENLAHLIREYQSVEMALARIGAETKQGPWTTGIVLGRSQFVSASAIAELLAHQEVPDARVASWLAAGMPPGASTASTLLATIHPGIVGLADDLRELATDFPVEDALLDESSPSDESHWYETLREQAHATDIVFATHAMLAVDNLMIHREQRTILPLPLALIVDEAHALEATQAQAGSQGLALSRIIATLRHAPWGQARCKTSAEEALSIAIESESALRAIPCDVLLPASRIADTSARRAWEHAVPVLARLAGSVDRLLGRLTKNLPAPLVSAKSVLKAASAALSAVEQQHHGAVTFSPMRRYPHITLGPRSVDQVLAARWELTPCGVLMSGTLLYPSLNGPLAEPLIARLMLPRARTRAVAPIHPHWLRSTPAVFTPAPSTAAAFSPPAGDVLTSQTLQAWLSIVAMTVDRHVATTAAGGTLVLMTGYERLRMLAALLEPGLGDRLVVQDASTMPLARAKLRFIDRASAGLRPVWLATGGAGVGLNLVDPDVPDDRAGDDLLLTDLVIPALPFGINRTSVQIERTSWAGFVSEKQEALRMFQQWIGRLVRRNGLRHRRLWVLDGRMLLPSTRSWTHEFLRIVQSYPNQQQVPLRG